MHTVRRVWEVVVAAWVASFLTRALLDWILGIEGTWLVVGTLVAAILGAAVGFSAARELEPWSLWDERDAYLGWATFIGFVIILVCLLVIPLPWGVLAAAAIAALTLAALRRAPPVPRDGTRDGEPV